MVSYPSRLPPNQQLICNDKWPVVGEVGPRSGDGSPWTVTVSCGKQRSEFTLAQLREWATSELVCDVHCVTRWSKYDMRFRGVRFRDLLAEAAIDTAGSDSEQFASFIARSDRNHSTSLPLQLAIDLDAFVALDYDGHPLATAHGGPVRMVVPGRYFYKSVKWLERIDILNRDRLGYWEADAGYHNRADPWREQRYVAASISKREATELIRSRNFSHRQLLGISARDRDLQGLQAVAAMLRNADFCQARLARANFSESNLSNAHFTAADLRQANFRNADLDGANFSKADLRGADLRAASMFGTTFVSLDDDIIAGAAIFDKKTLFDPKTFAGLTESQHKWLVAHL